MTLIFISWVLSSFALFYKHAVCLTVTAQASAVGATENSYFMLQVTFTATNPVSGYWSIMDPFGNEERIQPGAVYNEPMPGSLICPAFNKKLVGLYVFNATDGVSYAQNKPITVYLIGSPTVFTPRSQELVTAGHAVMLECVVISGEEIVDIKWLHKTQNGQSAYIDETNTSKYGGSTPWNPSLNMSSVDQNDEGYYWCYAEDNQGNTGNSSQIHLVLITESSNETSIDTAAILESSMLSSIEMTNGYSTTDAPRSQMTALYTIGTMTISEVDIGQSSLADIFDSSIVSTAELTDSHSSMGATRPQMMPLYTTVELNLDSTSLDDIDITQVTTLPQSITEIMTSLPSTATLINSLTGNDDQVTVEALCICDCKNQSVVDLFESQNLSQYTQEELRVIMRQDLDGIQDNLRVNKKNLSSTIRKLTSANDTRPTAMYIGSAGIAVLIIVVSTIIAADLCSIKQHVRNVLFIWRIKSRK